MSLKSFSGRNRNLYTEKVGNLTPRFETLKTKVFSSVLSLGGKIFSLKSAYAILRVFVSVVLIISFVFGSLPQTVFAANGTPNILSYQGRLTNSSGDLVGGSGTSYYFKFSIWDSSTVLSGNKLWPTAAPTSFSTTVRQGVFNVNIGDTDNGYPDTLDYNFNTNKDIYLQVEVSSDGLSFETLSPRHRISAAAFAEIAGQLSGTGQSSIGTTSPIANALLTIQSTSTTALGQIIRAYS